MGYPAVSIKNMTQYNAAGDVTYASVFCSDDEFTVNAWQEWKASSRGSCLVTKISAILHTPDGLVNAEPYYSSGTSYSTFTIAPSPAGYRVYRVSADRNVTDDDGVPSDYVEPTEKQK